MRRVVKGGGFGDGDVGGNGRQVPRLLFPDLVLQNLGLDLEIGELLAQALGFDTQLFSLLLAQLDFLLHHDAPLDGDIVL